MTNPDPARRWCLEAVDVLRDTATAAGRLAAAVAVDWRDEHGDGWSHRIAALRRSLEDAAQHAADLAGRLPDPDGARDPARRVPDGAPTDLAAAMAAALRAASPSSRPTGPRLADTSGARAADDHGMRIGELPDPPH